MSDDLRRLISDAEKLGFTYDGVNNNGHIQFVNKSGRRCVTSSTPSDKHSWENALKDMEKISGRQLPRDNKGKYTFKRVNPMNLERSKTEVKDLGVVDGLVARAESLRSEFMSLVGVPNRNNAQRARNLIVEFNEVRDELATYHRIVDPIY